MSRLTWKSLLILGVALFALIAGCATTPGVPPATTEVSPSPTATPVSSGPPSIQILSPPSGTVIPPGNVTVTVSVNNFILVEKLGQSAAPGEGHIHYFIDAVPPVEQGKPAITAPGTYVPTTATSYTWQNVSPGPHTFAVELVNNDHTPLNPPITAVVSINAAAPSVRIISPRNAEIVGPDNFTVSIAVDNFQLVDKLGQPNVPGEGHVHYFLDVAPPTAPGIPAITTTGRYVPTTALSYTWFNVTPGIHPVAVELVNNDHTPLVPPVTDSIQIIIGSVGAGGSGGGGGGY